jgi:hypothetical protein
VRQRPASPASSTACAGLSRPGRELPDEQWQQHHRVVLRTLAGLAVGVAGYALFSGYGALAAVGFGAPVALLALAARAPMLSRGERAVLAATGLVTAAAGAVHVSGGHPTIRD